MKNLYAAALSVNIGIAPVMAMPANKFTARQLWALPDACPSLQNNGYWLLTGYGLLGPPDEAAACRMNATAAQSLLRIVIDWYFLL